ncbi:flavodoxin family protein [Aliarcobacter skirrowii]|uniref:NAD(P)H-dependent oxidoreductase n=1 Tax=Aliarcobacter skirrowii TaxID=28200 RepID=UPI000F680755|nr:NAD(P)H-dependent oxidoreductase [Aliarcobacter skirrowii]AZL54345.1 flavodoxin family protein [Aliarcobacter skirrowii]
MKKVLILNGHQYEEGISEGKLTKKILEKAEEFFIKNGFEVKTTNIEQGYDSDEEGKKFEWADIVLFQFPVFWMTMPWVAKKYFDDTFVPGVHYANDGRSREDVNKKYGSGGLLKNKKYMLSLTYNCPKKEFNNPDGFFNGMSVDEANVAVHKTFQFVGLEAVETFTLFDVFKGELDLKKELIEFERILEKNFI